MRRGFLLLIACAALAASCTAGGAHRDSGTGFDAGRQRDAGFDAGNTFCDDNLDCDDSQPCTDQICVVGNVCEYTTFDSRCNAAANEHCVIGRGCIAALPTDCTEDSDCDDSQYCNGVEQCIGEMCFNGTARSCNDGNECTIDACDEDEDGCTYDIAPGCDAGTSTGFDAGMPCDPFEAADYVGTFSFAPPVSAACTSSAVYNITRMTISVSSSLTISLNSAPFSLTQATAPTGAAFDASYSDSCGSYRLQGMFTCADRWEGTWTANFQGLCAGTCGNQNVPVRGSRR